MGDRVGKLMAVPRFDALLLGIFAAMALLLAAIGLYGVVAFLVAQRTQEIGVRMALGATPGGIAKLVLGRAARWTFAGAAIGLAASLAGARVMQSLLYHVQPRDPLALGVSLIVLIAVAMLAAFVPARRAAAVDPMVALRHE
jgi:ABC-type antimicrobial peptide transport system permease subunit